MADRAGAEVGIGKGTASLEGWSSGGGNGAAPSAVYTPSVGVMLRTSRCTLEPEGKGRGVSRCARSPAGSDCFGLGLGGRGE